MSKANSVSGQLLIVIARICLSVIFILAGFDKIVSFTAVANNLGTLNVPYAKLILGVAVAFEFGGGLFLLLGWHARMGAWMLIIFTLLATVLFHAFWELDGAAAATHLQHFLKNLTMVGGLLYVAVFGPGKASLDNFQGRS